MGTEQDKRPKTLQDIWRTRRRWWRWWWWWWWYLSFERVYNFECLPRDSCLNFQIQNIVNVNKERNITYCKVYFTFNCTFVFERHICYTEMINPTVIINALCNFCAKFQCCLSRPSLSFMLAAASKMWPNSSSRISTFLSQTSLPFQPHKQNIRKFGLGIQTVLYLLHTPWSRIILEKTTGFQLVKKFPAFYGSRMVITAFTSAHHLSLSKQL